MNLRQTIRFMLVGALGFLAACGSGDPSRDFVEDTADMAHTSTNLPVTAADTVLYTVNIDDSAKSLHQIVFVRSVMPWPGGRRNDVEVVLAYEKWQGRKSMILKGIYSNESTLLRNERQAFEMAKAILGGAAGGAVTGWTMPQPKASAYSNSTAQLSSRDYSEDIDLANQSVHRQVIVAAMQLIGTQHLDAFADNGRELTFETVIEVVQMGGRILVQQN